jgi:hypothetical protein
MDILHEFRGGIDHDGIVAGSGEREIFSHNTCLKRGPS